VPNGSTPDCQLLTKGGLLIANPFFCSALPAAPLPPIAVHYAPMAEVIPIGSDHAGYQLNERLIEELRARGYEPLDLGTHSPESTDYPDYAHEVACKMEKIDRGNG